MQIFIHTQFNKYRVTTYHPLFILYTCTHSYLHAYTHTCGQIKEEGAKEKRNNKKAFVENLGNYFSNRFYLNVSLP